MALPKPKTRQETFLAAAAGESVALPDPVTRKETFLAKAAGMSVVELEPVTREEMYLNAITGGGGGEAVLIDKTVSANGTYTASDDNADGYKKFKVMVSNTYEASDEGKVVNNGSLVAQTSDTATSNGTVDTTLINSLTVAVPSKDYEANDWLDLSKPAGAVTSAIEMTSGSYILLAWHTGITSVTLTESTYIPGNFVRGCTALTAFSAPKAEGTLGGGAFQNTTNLASLHLPNGKLSSDTCNSSGIVTGVFWGMKDNAVSNALRSCANLERVDFTGNAGNVGSNTFQSTKLNTLVLRSTAVVGLSNVSVFSGSSFASGGTGGTLYVPQALISSYQAATNWSTILGYANNQIKAIEGSIYENAYADGVPIS